MFVSKHEKITISGKESLETLNKLKQGSKIELVFEGNSINAGHQDAISGKITYSMSGGNNAKGSSFNLQDSFEKIPDLNNFPNDPINFLKKSLSIATENNLSIENLKLVNPWFEGFEILDIGAKNTDIKKLTLEGGVIGNIKFFKNFLNFIKDKESLNILSIKNLTVDFVCQNFNNFKEEFFKLSEGSCNFSVQVYFSANKLSSKTFEDDFYEKLLDSASERKNPLGLYIKSYSDILEEKIVSMFKNFVFLEREDQADRVKENTIFFDNESSSGSGINLFPHLLEKNTKIEIKEGYEKFHNHYPFSLQKILEIKNSLKQGKCDISQAALDFARTREMWHFFQLIEILPKNLEIKINYSSGGNDFGIFTNGIQYYIKKLCTLGYLYRDKKKDNDLINIMESAQSVHDSSVVELANFSIKKLLEQSKNLNIGNSDKGVSDLVEILEVLKELYEGPDLPFKLLSLHKDPDIKNSKNLQGKDFFLYALDKIKKLLGSHGEGEYRYDYSQEGCVISLKNLLSLTFGINQERKPGEAEVKEAFATVYEAVFKDPETLEEDKEKIISTLKEAFGKKEFDFKERSKGKIFELIEGVPEEKLEKEIIELTGGSIGDFIRIENLEPVFTI